MRPFLVSIFLVASTLTFSQQFKGEASLPAVEVDRFYKIVISPEVSPYFNTRFSNIRIYDQQNAEVPYLFQKESPSYYSEKFKEYEIVERKQEKNCCTSLMLRNPSGQAINNISLSIKNAEVTKHATLLGSDDKENWFALKQHFVLSSLNNQNKTSEIKIVDFPLSNYVYYLLQIEDSTSAPINILSAGYYEMQSEDGKYSQNYSLHFIKSDSAKQKRTYIKISFDTTQVVDKLVVSLAGQPYFLRKATLYSKEERKNKKGETEFYYNHLYDFELSSKQISILNLPGIKVSELLIIVENEDNPSLDIASLKTFQLNRYLTSWLKKENSYTIKIGSEELQSPSYDLAFFQDKIPDQSPQLSIGSVTIFKEKAPEISTTIFTSTSVIWIAIILVIIVLGLLSVKLIKETNAAKNKIDF